MAVSHSSPGHIRANGSLHHSDTHKHCATDTHEDMLTHFCLRGCGKPTLHLPRKSERGRRGGKWVWKRGEGRGAKIGKRRWSGVFEVGVGFE